MIGLRVGTHMRKKFIIRLWGCCYYNEHFIHIDEFLRLLVCILLIVYTWKLILVVPHRYNP